MTTYNMISQTATPTCRRFLTTRRCQGSSRERKSGESLLLIAATTMDKGNSRSGADNNSYTGTIQNKKYDHSVYRTFSKQQRNRLRLLRLKSSGDSGSSSGLSSGQKRTISAVTTPETAAEKKLQKKKQGAGVRFGSSGRKASVVEEEDEN